MRKYRWSLIKTLEFLNSRRPELEIKASFIQQLQDFEVRLNQAGIGALSTTFNEYSFRDNTGKRVQGINVSNELEAEEAILRNTFVNSQPTQQPKGFDQNGAATQPVRSNRVQDQQFTLRWVDQASRNKIPLWREGPLVNHIILPRDQ